MTKCEVRNSIVDIVNILGNIVTGVDCFIVHDTLISDIGDHEYDDDDDIVDMMMVTGQYDPLILLSSLQL